MRHCERGVGMYFAGNDGVIIARKNTCIVVHTVDPTSVWMLVSSIGATGSVIGLCGYFFVQLSLIASCVT